MAEQADERVARLEREQGQREHGEDGSEEGARKQLGSLHEEEDEHEGRADEQDAGSVDRAAALDQEVVQHRDRRVDVQPGPDRQAADGEPGDDENGRRKQRPARPPTVEQRARKADEHERHDVEEVAVARRTRAETQVEHGHLEQDRDDRERADARERVQLLRRRTHEIREQPRHTDDERQDREPEREDGGVLQEGAPEAVRDEVAAERAGVGPEEVGEAPDGRGDEAGGYEHGVGDGKDRVRVDGSTPRPAEVAVAHCELVRDHDDGNHDEQYDELRPREDGEREREQEQDVVSPRGCGRRRLQREHRPQKRRVTDGLGEQERGEHDPGHADGQGRDRVGHEAASGHPPGEEVRRDARGAREPGVQHVRVVEGAGHETVPEDRCEQDGVELADVRNELVVDPRQEGAVLGDADRKPLVEQLVGHHVPVDDT